MIDSRRCASAGLGMLVVQAAQYAGCGMDFATLLQVVEQMIDDTTVFFCIDTLEYLRRGGRIGRVTAVAGVAAADQADSDHRHRRRHRHRRQGAGGATPPLPGCWTWPTGSGPTARRGVPFNLLVCDGAWPEEGKRLAAELKKRIPGCHQILRGSIDATLAVHLGPPSAGLRGPVPAHTAAAV